MFFSLYYLTWVSSSSSSLGSVWLLSLLSFRLAPAVSCSQQQQLKSRKCRLTWLLFCPRHVLLCSFHLKHSAIYIHTHKQLSTYPGEQMTFWSPSASPRHTSQHHTQNGRWSLTCPDLLLLAFVRSSFTLSRHLCPLPLIHDALSFFILASCSPTHSQMTLFAREWGNLIRQVASVRPLLPTTANFQCDVIDTVSSIDAHLRRQREPFLLRSQFQLQIAANR